MEQDITFVMHTEEGNVTMTVLFTFYSELTDANYMLYTPDPLDGSRQVRISAARYDPMDLSKLMPLKDDRDRAIVQSYLEYVATHTPEEMAAEAQSQGACDGTKGLAN